MGEGYKTGKHKGRMQGFFHGTGHGVGAFLNVHEGPQRIAQPRGQEDVLVILCLSGGGSRAAWFSAATMLRLERVVDEINLLHEVDVISSVSGGGLPAAIAPFGKNETRLLDANDVDALKRIQMGYKAIALKPIAKTFSMSLKIAQLAHDDVERLPRTGGLARAAVDDEVVGPLGHIGVQVVHQHAQGGFLEPAPAGQLCPARGADDASHALLSCAAALPPGRT